MKKLTLFLFLLTFTFAVSAQDPSRVNLGIGFGLDYGGIGTRFGFLPDPHFGLFGGVGFNFDGVGYNLGAQYRFNPASRTVAYASAMYGYNAVVNADIYSIKSTKTYYGPSVAVGVEFHGRAKPNNFFNLELVLPFRSSEFYDEVDALKALGASVTYSPIAISIGYHFGLD